MDAYDELIIIRVKDKIKNTNHEKIIGFTGDLTNMETLFAAKEFFQKKIKSFFILMNKLKELLK